MPYAALLKARFPDLNPQVDDLFLLEAHQVAALPDRAPPQGLADVLHARPALRGFFIARHPPVVEFLSRLPAARARGGEEGAGDLLWELADWIVYQRAPEMYDADSTVVWDLAAVTEVTDLTGKVVVDGGAGTGRVAFAAAPHARHVFAVEPVAALRRYMRDKAQRLEVTNLSVVDGFLNAIPLPNDSADLLLTCQAIGWDLPHELQEIERVLRAEGDAIHLFGTGEESNPLYEQLVGHGYQPGSCVVDGGRILRFHQAMAP